MLASDLITFLQDKLDKTGEFAIRIKDTDTNETISIEIIDGKLVYTR